MFGNQRHDSPGQIFVSLLHICLASYQDILERDSLTFVTVKVNLLSICSKVSQAAGFTKRRAPQVHPRSAGVWECVCTQPHRQTSLQFSQRQPGPRLQTVTLAGLHGASNATTGGPFIRISVLPMHPPQTAKFIQ